MTMDEAERRILGLESLVFSSIPIDRIDHLEPLLADLSVSVEAAKYLASETKEKLDTLLYPLLRRIADDLQAGKLSDVNQEDYLSLLSAGGVFPVCQTERS